MSDTLQIVTLSAGGRPILVKDLDDGSGYYRSGDSFKFVPGAAQAVLSSRQRRYGGASIAGVTHDNAQVSWTALVTGATNDLGIANAEALIAQIENAARGRLLAWKPSGASTALTSYFEIVGPGVWDPDYKFVGANLLQITLTFPVKPLVLWAPETIRDPFDVDSISDYSFDAGASGNVTVTGGALDAVANLTTENRMIHTARGYNYAAAQATLKATPGVTITSFKAGVILNRVDALNYAEVYVDDSGTNSRLRIDTISGGTRTNRTSLNLGARIVNGTPFWVRGRVETSTVIAEYFTSAPTPMGTPTSTTNSGVVSLTAGKAGVVWTPQHTNATLDDLAIEPRVFRNQTLPEKITLRSVPGTAPAQVCLAVTPSGGSAAPVWALVGWTTTPAAGTPPFGILEAETAGDLTLWASAADAGSRGGNRLTRTVAGAESLTASWTVDPSLLVADDFTDGELSVELWAVASITSTLVSPKLTASVRPFEGLNFGAERFTDDYGSAGKLLTLPSAGTVRRLARLGTVTMPADPLRPRTVKLWVAGSTAAGSTGVFALDYLMLVPARARALSPSAKAFDAAFPRFVISTGETTKLIRPDLSGSVSKPPNAAHPDHGLGGSLLELPPGDVDLLVKLSNRVPDDPTVDANTEQLAHSATVQALVTPRSFMLRSA